MPISCAVSKSTDTARMAIPTLVWLISWVRPTTSRITRMGVMSTTSLVGVPAMVTVFVRPAISG